MSKNLPGGQSELGKECGCRFEWGEGADAGLKALGGLEHERHNLACLTGITVSFVWEKDCEGWRVAEEKCDEVVAGAPGEG